MYLNMPNLHFLPCNPVTSKARLTATDTIACRNPLLTNNHHDPLPVGKWSPNMGDALCTSAECAAGLGCSSKMMCMWPPASRMAA